MDFRHLEYFVEIAKDNNITRAAERLFVSQSAVNQHLLKLEQEFGTQLFVRDRRNWRLTEAGKVYLEGCRKALLIRKDTYRKIADITQSHSGNLTIGLTPNRGLTMFTTIYPNLRDKYPEQNIIPMELDAKSQMRAALHGEIDLGFMVQPFPLNEQFISIDLGSEEMVVLVPQDNPICYEILANYKNPEHLPTIDISKLSAEAFVMTQRGSSADVHRQMCDKIFEAAGFVPRILMETSSTLHVVSMAEACQCCAIIPRYYASIAHSSLRQFVLQDHPSWHLYMIHRRAAYLTSAAKYLIQLAKNYWSVRLIPPQK